MSDVTTAKLAFTSDYMEGCHPAVLDALAATNLVSVQGYGEDPFCRAAEQKILSACGCPDGEVRFLTGGTQTNALLVDCLTEPWQGVFAAETGHISVHEAGAVEFTGHKVLALPHTDGKISAEAVRKYCKDFLADPNHEHMVEPGLVYISHPTEYGTLYSKAELTALHEVCAEAGIPLYLDGARLAYALAAPENDVTLPDLARLCDVFYIGGTKCGALCGEAVVLPKKGSISHFTTRIKQHGALLAKGRVLGVQFDALFTDGLYERIGAPALESAARIKEKLRACGFPLFLENPTNQVFFVLANDRMERLAETVEFGYMEKYDDTHSVLRFATAWSTTPEKTDALLAALDRLSQDLTDA